MDFFAKQSYQESCQVRTNRLNSTSSIFLVNKQHLVTKINNCNSKYYDVF